MKIHLAEALALLLSLAAVVASAWVGGRFLEGLPHLEDELAYVWQAKALVAGQLKIESPPHPKSYLVPFVVDHEGERFGKYPPGWPAVLAVGVGLGLRTWVNPLLAGVGVWLTYLLGKRIFGHLVGLLAAGLTLTSPFFLMNSASLLSHPLGMALSAAFSLAWLKAFTEPAAKRPWLSTLAAALALGMLILTRPMTAVAVAFPFALHGLFLLLPRRADPGGLRQIRARLLVFGLLGLGFAGFYGLWQYALTGNPLLNPYTLWWPYDQIGFGPGHGVAEGGHSLLNAYDNTLFSLVVGKWDLFGWGGYSWIFLPFGLWAAQRNRPAWLVGGVIFSIVLIYALYWIGSWLFGPRYHYEGLYSLTLFSAAGIAWLAGWPVRVGEALKVYKGWRRLRPLTVTALLGVLLAINLILYLPIRLQTMHGLYGITRADQAPFAAASVQGLSPALIIVHTAHWMDYGALLDLEDPFLSTPFIFAWSRGVQLDAELSEDFPGRAVYHYYPEEPYVFYLRMPSPGQ